MPRAVDDTFAEPLAAPLPGPDPGRHLARTDVGDHRHAHHPGVGRHAHHPLQIPWAGWRTIVTRAAKEMMSDNISLVAAGCAFYATLALFPAITMFISVYGLVFDRTTVEPQLNTLAAFLPPAAYQLIHDRVHALVAQPAQTLGIGLFVSAGLAFWSAASGTKSMLSALNVAYEEKEKRGFIRFQLTALVITLCAVLGAVVALGLLVGLPAVFAFIGLSSGTKLLIQAASFLMLVAFVMGALAVLYRFGPSRRPAAWKWVTPGSVAATVLWLVVSVLFSIYVGHFASYSVTYGPIGAVVGVMMWFYVTVYAILIGAELNAELELQTAQDSTEGESRPMGDRGAFVADHVAH